MSKRSNTLIADDIKFYINDKEIALLSDIKNNVSFDMLSFRVLQLTNSIKDYMLSVMMHDIEEFSIEAVPEDFADFRIMIFHDMGRVIYHFKMSEDLVDIFGEYNVLFTEPTLIDKFHITAMEEEYEPSNNIVVFVTGSGLTTSVIEYNIECSKEAN